MRRSLVFSTESFRPLPQLAQQAEAAGFDRVWTTESTSRDAIIRALTIGHATRSIGVATGITYAFTRSPLAMAATAADVHIATNGRFTLGLGAGTKGMRTRRYDVTSFDHPGSRLGDYTALMRAAWNCDDAGLSYRGRFYSAQVHGSTRSAELDGLPPIPVVGSGVNETMLRLSARYCDGVALHPLLAFRDYLDRVVMPAIRDGGSTNVAPPWVAAWCPVSVATEEDVARWRARASLGFHFTTPSYQRITEGTRWEATTRALCDRFRADPTLSRERLAESVPAAMADEFCLIASPESLPHRLAALEADLSARGIAEIVLQPVGTGLADTEYVRLCSAVISNAGRSDAA